MDATTPFRRWLRAGFPLLLAVGCETVDRPAPVARPQAPSEPLPPPPVQPTAPVTGSPVGPVSPAVGGKPLAPATPVGYTPGGPITAKLPDPNAIARVKVVAVVGEANVVYDHEIWEAVRQRQGEYLSIVDGPNGKEVRRDDGKEKAIYGEELRQVIARELILDEMYTRLKKAKKADVLDQIKDFAGKAADRWLREMKKERGLKTDEELRLFFSAQGLTVPVVRRQIERQMMAEEYVRSMLKEKGKGVGLAELHDYYDKHPDEFRTEDRVKWLDIFISFNKFETPRAAYDHALAIQQNAAGGADFAALSLKYDHGVAGPAGGEGIGTKRGEIRPTDVEPTVWALQVGQVSGLVETPGGYHIVKVAERDVAGVRPFDDKVQDDIRKKLMKALQEREYKRMVEDLWRKGVVKVMPQG